MKQELQVIDERVIFEKQFRIYGDFENPLFLAKDVAEWIDYAYKDKSKGTRNVNMMVGTVDEDEKLVATIFTSGQRREVIMLTEDGLYEVLMQSRKPIAKQFKKKVKEVLKEVRKTGSYISKKDQLMLNILNANSEEERLTAFSNYQIEYVKPLEKTIQIQAPKVSYHDKVLQSDGLLKVTDISKDYGMSAVRFNRLLNDLNIQYKQGRTWYLYSRYQDCNYTKTKTSIYEDSEGVEHSAVHTYWTQSGRKFLYEKLKEVGVLPLSERTELIESEVRTDE